MLDVELRRIVPKAAGTYFIVRDNSQVEEIENENKMRLFFINVEQGPTNMALSFAQGDITGFQSTFGRGNRMMKKKGNFSIDTCVDALAAGPITVVNLRAFDDELDTCGVCGMNMNNTNIASTKQVVETSYRSLFNLNTFWVPNYDAMNNLVENAMLNFANIGNSDISIFVVRSTNVDTITSEGNLSLANCQMEIDEYPAIDFNTLVKDTIVDVYLFANTFDPKTVGTNKFYGNLFDSDGNLVFDRIQELCDIPEAGYVRMFTGSVIPNLNSETGNPISINTVINTYFMETGLICDINEDLFELEHENFIDANGYSFYDVKASGSNLSANIKTNMGSRLLSHVLPVKLTVEQDSTVATAHAYKIPVEILATDAKKFNVPFSAGIRYGDFLQGKLGPVSVTAMEIVGDSEDLDDNTIVTITCTGELESFGTVYENLAAVNDDVTTYASVTKSYVLKYNDIVGATPCKPYNLKGCKARDDQFINGTANRQNEILNMMLDPGIVKGLCGINGLRYVVDCFKSYVESGYKSQYGQLMEALDERNRFVRAIINEPFIDDMAKSKNPIFAQTPNGTFDISYLTDGGNKTFSTKLLTKFAAGADKCFFFGPGEKVNNVLVGLAGKISNLFYQKTNAFDVVANTTGIIDGIEELEYPLDDNDRMYCEKFRWNPIINLRGSNRIFGNNTGQELRTAQQQITNSELLAYIKETLYNQAKTEHFKRGTYDNYLRVETMAKNFMESLVLAGVIDAGFVCECNTTNNTLEIRKQRIMVVHIEYTPVDVIEKIVFDLTIN